MEEEAGAERVQEEQEQEEEEEEEEEEEAGAEGRTGGSTSSTTSSVYLRGPASLPQPPHPALRAVIRPEGTK